MSNEVELPVRQAAVIYLKNMVSFECLFTRVFFSKLEILLVGSEL